MFPIRVVVQEKYKYLGGYIAFAFYGLGAPASLTGGWLADRVDRRLLFVTMATVGQCGALGTAFAKNYSQVGGSDPERGTSR